MPMGIGCAISLTAFTAYSLVGAQNLPIETALGAVFIAGITFTIVSVTGIRAWLLRNIPEAVAHGTGVGVGLFLFLIASKGVGLIVPGSSMPVALGDLFSVPALLSLLGLILVIALNYLQVTGAVLISMIAITIIGMIVDQNIHFQGIAKLPTLDANNHFFSLDIVGALTHAIVPVFALVMTSLFDATGVIRAIAGNAGLVKENGEIVNGGRALTSDSLSTLEIGRAHV